MTIHNLKAYAVLESGECTGGIIFEQHAIVARRLGANEYGDGDFSSVTCRRAPWADAYAERYLPASLMIENGWHFECSHCGNRLTEESLHENHLPIGGVIGTQHSHVFCGSRCARKHYSLQRRRKNEEQRAIKTFKDIVRRRFPDVEFCDEEDDGLFRSYHHAYVVAGNSGWQWRQVSVGFRFPGMKVGAANFSVNDNSRFPPPEARYTCCSGDIEAFKAYVALTLSETDI